MFQILNNKISFWSIFLLLNSFSVQTISGLNVDLNSPRIGDNLMVLVLDNVQDNKMVDLSSATLANKSYFSVFPPAKEDTLTTMVILSDKNNINLLSKNQNLYILNTYQPGEKRVFHSMTPYLFPVNDSENKIDSSGTLSGIGHFESHGHKIFENDSALKLITLDNDTVYNVECLTSYTDELLIYENSDSVLHKSIIKQWFIPGYRYPALKYTSDYLITLDGDTVDYVNRWEAIDLKHQEETIKDDTVNEMIRNALNETNIFNNFVNNYDAESKSPTIRKNNIEWSTDNETISVLHSLNDADTVVEYILCDVSGRVFAHGSILTSDGFTLSLHTYPPGVYVFSLKNQDGINSLKITKS